MEDPDSYTQPPLLCLDLLERIFEPLVLDTQTCKRLRLTCSLHKYVVDQQAIRKLSLSALNLEALAGSPVPLYARFPQIEELIIHVSDDENTMAALQTVRHFSLPPTF